MIDSRVRELRVRIRTDVPEPNRLRRAAERLVRAALERCIWLLEERSPGRVVLFRSLPMRLQIDEATLAEPEQVEEIARATAARIERAAPAVLPDFPSSSETAVFFENEAHLRASHLHALSRGGSAWFHAGLGSEGGDGGEGESMDPLAALAAPDKLSMAEAVLGRLARTGVLAEVLAARPESAARALASALGLLSEPGFRPESAPVQPAGDGRTEVVRGVQSGGGVLESSLAARDPRLPKEVQSLVLVAATWPPLSGPARALAFHAHAASILGGATSGAGVRALARAAMSWADSAASRADLRGMAGDALSGSKGSWPERAGDALSGDAPSGSDGSRPERAGDGPLGSDGSRPAPNGSGWPGEGLSGDGAAPSKLPIMEGTDSLPRDGLSPSARAGEPGRDGAEARSPQETTREGLFGAEARSPQETTREGLFGVDPRSGAPVVDTSAAGLFFLLSRIVELGLGEALWKACLPESAVLACAARALLGPDFADDPAIPLFAGAAPPSACPAVLPEQHEEIALSVLVELAAAFPRRGLATLPPILLSRADLGADRLLVAAAEDSPFALFAWPAPTPAAFVRALRAFLQVWPHGAPVSAAPGLAELDDTGRVRPRRGVATADLLLPRAPSTEASALLALVIGAPCALFATRAGAPPLSCARDFVTAYLARRARVEVGAERLRVVLRARDADIDVRRAGLDRDPGWLAWLSRSVHFDFKEGAGGPAAGGSP